MVGRHQWLNGHEFGPTQGDSEGQGSLKSGVLQFTRSQRVGHDLAAEHQQAVHIIGYNRNVILNRIKLLIF